MYIYLDQPVGRLGEGERFILWAMRGWSHAIERGLCPPLALCRGFTAVDALTALPDFHIAMALLNRDALAKISVGPMEYEKIMEDEAILLGLWRDIALGDFDHMRATLAFLIEEDVVGAASQAMTTAMAKFVAAGFDLSGLVREILKEEK